MILKNPLKIKMKKIENLEWEGKGERSEKSLEGRRISAGIYERWRAGGVWFMAGSVFSRQYEVVRG